MVKDWFQRSYSSERCNSRVRGKTPTWIAPENLYCSLITSHNEIESTVAIEIKQFYNSRLNGSKNRSRLNERSVRLQIAEKQHTAVIIVGNGDIIITFMIEKISGGE